MARRYDILMRLLLVGDTGVGKTCLLCRYANDEFFDTHISTIGIDFKMKTVLVGGKTVKVQIWDTAGQERFESITKQFYRRAEGIMLVYDITNMNSFDGVEKWISYIRQHTALKKIMTNFNGDRFDKSFLCKKLTREDPAMMLLGNKSDQKHKRRVPYKMAQQFAQNNNMKYSEVSAKYADNIDEAFLKLIQEVLNLNSLCKQKNGVDNLGAGAGLELSDHTPLLKNPSRSSSKDEEADKELGPTKWACCSLS